MEANRRPICAKISSSVAKNRLRPLAGVAEGGGGVQCDGDHWQVRGDCAMKDTVFLINYLLYELFIDDQLR